MTNPPPVAPVVTDEMLLKAATAYEDEMRMSFKTSTVYIEPLKAAITAALEASGEIERLRAALHNLTDCLHVDVRMSGPTYSIVNGTRFQKAAKAAFSALQGDVP